MRKVHILGELHYLHFRFNTASRPPVEPLIWTPNNSTKGAIKFPSCGPSCPPGTPMEKVRGEVLWRSASIGPEDISADERTVDLAFASDKPISHSFGDLVLSMDSKAVRLDRMKSGAPLLLNHDTDSQIGVIEQVTLGADGMARAKVRFSRSSLGEEIYQDVIDGIRRSVSVGFVVHDLVQESRAKSAPVYRATDWEPLEVSIVSVPADYSVGIGRSLSDFTDAPTREFSETEEPIMEKEQITEPTAPVENVRAAEIETAESIIKFGELYGESELARDFALQGKTVADLRVAIADKRAKATVNVEPAEPKVEAARQGHVEIAHTPSVGKLKSFKDARAAYRSGKFLQAVLGRSEEAMRFCKDNGLIRAAQSGDTSSLGGALVPEEFESAVIDLRNTYGVFRANANVVPMNSDTKIRPRRTGGLTAYAVGAGDAITESNKTWDNVSLVAKKWGVLAKYENELGEDAVISIADDLASEIAYAFAKKEDECGFNGDGSSTYHGIVGVTEKLKGLSATIANIAGLQVGTGNAYSELTLGDIQGLVGKLPSFARRAGNNKFYCSQQFYANVLQRLAQAVGGVTYAEISGQIAQTFFGVPVEIVDVMPSTEANSQVCLLYGNLAQAAMLGDRRGVSVAMTDSNSTDFASDVMAVRGTTRFDINVHDVGNASATASAREAGPIVGLITAAS